MLEVPEYRQLKRGLLFAIEGIDGAGKTTQSKILTNRLKESGYSVDCFHEPTDGVWGKKIRELAKNGRDETNPKDELKLFYRDRLEDVKKNIKPSLRMKRVVIMDRYYFSSVAYQGARGLNPDNVEEINKKIAPRPDKTIILDINVEVSSARIRHGRNSIPNYFERKEHLERVREIFLAQFRERQDVRIIDGDGNRSVENVAAEIWGIIEPIVRDTEETHISKRAA